MTEWLAQTCTARLVPTNSLGCIPRRPPPSPNPGIAEKLSSQPLEGCSPIYARGEGVCCVEAICVPEEGPRTFPRDVPRTGHHSAMLAHSGKRLPCLKKARLSA